MANLLVWRAVLISSVGAALAAFHIGSINGMFEMPGFQGTFPQLFEHSDNCTKDPITGKLYSTFENVTIACGMCYTAKVCGGSGAGASSILGMMVSAGNVGATFGAAFGGWPSTVIGRKLTLSISGLIMAVGSLLSAVSFDTWLFTIGRGISGFSMGLTYGSMAVYISEMSPKTSRGKLASIIGPVYGLSMAFQFASNCGYSLFCQGWRISFAVQILVGLGYAIMMLFLPQTPRWLVLRGRTGEAHLVLTKINGLSEKGFVQTMLDLEDLKSTTSQLPKNYFKGLALQFSKIVKWKYFKRLLLCCTLFFITPLIGNFTYYFGNTFFCKLNIDPCTSNAIVGFSLLLGGVFVAIFVDRAGRKLILLGSTVLMLLLQSLMTALIEVFDLQEEENIPAGYALTALFCTYALVYSGSWLTVPWVISSEVFPVETRGLKVAISSAVFWFAAALVTQIIPILIDSFLGIAGFMYLLIGVTVIALFVILFGLPETKGVSLEAMDELFSRPLLERVGLANCLSRRRISISSKIKSNVTEENLKGTELKDDIKPS